jgi:hypothetical protein
LPGKNTSCQEGKLASKMITREMLYYIITK